mmetsp:Transcript_39546/g.35338  ORF Transcript_39546/g.35338 Transcript_39546/m.35338 type:complete len:90 (-) Transcript_39546:580-849(-)
MYKDKQIDKLARLMMFSSRVIFLLLFASLFLSDSQVSQQEEESGSFEVKPELNPYFILLPYVTVIPVQAILIALISARPPKIENGKQMP